MTTRILAFLLLLSTPAFADPIQVGTDRAQIDITLTVDKFVLVGYGYPIGDECQVTQICETDEDGNQVCEEVTTC